MKTKLNPKIHWTLLSAPAVVPVLFWLGALDASFADDFKQPMGRWQRTGGSYVRMK